MKLFHPVKSLFATAILGGAIMAVQAAPIEVGALNFPPYYELENESKVTGGYFVDFLKTLLTHAGIEHKFSGYPPKRLYTNVGEGTVQLWMGPVGVPEFEGKVLVSPKQISEINMEVYTMGSVESLPKTIDDFKGKSVITIRGYTYGGMITALNDPKNNIKVEIANTHEAAFQMLQAGRATFLLDYIEPATETLAKLKFPSINKRSIKTLPIFILLSKTLPDAQGTMDKIMKSYEKLNAESKAKAEAIYKKT